MDKNEIKRELARRELSLRLLEYFVPQVDPFYGNQDKEYIFKPFHKILTDALERALKKESKRIMISVPPQHGKEISNSELVFTDNGWKTHGELHKGDVVFNHTGKPVKVEGESEQTQSEYRITFSNGQTIDCHGNHEWVLSKDKRKYTVYETKEIYNNGWIRKEGDKKRCKYRLIPKEPVEIEGKNLLVDPYLLGFWLGDGTTTSGTICKPKNDLNSVLEKVYTLGYINGSVNTHPAYDLDKTTILGLQPLLKKIGVFGNKHIPQEYLIGSIQQRLELLAGLIDSDGYVYNDTRWGGGSRVTFTNTNKNLIDGVQFICDTFGWNTYNYSGMPPEHGNIKPKKLVYTISFNPTLDIPCVIQRKKIIVNKSIKSVGITNIEKIEGLEMGKCIQVESGIYLVGKKMIPTHNSTISTQRFPLFAHLQNPTLNIVSASYSGDLAKSHLGKIRQILESPQFQVLGKPLNLTKNDSTEYQLKEGGSYYSVGVGGGLTGRPIDIGIIDDVHKDRMEYESDTIRNGVWDWYSSVFQSRLHKDSIIIGVMTRWGEDDLFGRILQAEGDIWEIINIPVYNEDETETIFPERFPLLFMKEKQKGMMPRDFQSLYMGDPLNEGGGDFKREYFVEYDHLPTELEIVTFIDPAISQKQEADNTAIVTIGLDKRNNNIFVLEIKAGKMLPDEIIDNVFETFTKWKPKRIGLEVVAYQKMLALEIKKQMNIRNLYFVLDEITPQGEKEARIRTILQPRYSNHSVWHNNAQALELELLKFPNGKHDDMADALASAVNMLSTHNISNLAKIAQPKTYFNRMTGKIEVMR